MITSTPKFKFVEDSLDEYPDYEFWENAEEKAKDWFLVWNKRTEEGIGYSLRKSRISTCNWTLNALAQHKPTLLRISAAQVRAKLPPGMDIPFEI